MEQTLRAALKSGRVWVLSLIYFCLVVAMYGIALWLPLMLESITGFSDFLIGVVSVFPYLAAALFMVVIGFSSDKTGERILHLSGSLILSAAGFFLSLFSDSPAGSIFCLIIAAAGIWGALGPFWAFAGSFLVGRGAAAGFALINSIGNLGGFTGPALMGFFRDATGSYKMGMFLLGMIILGGGLLSLLLKLAGKPRKAG